jgi:transcriptional regulator with XRE-family HTH domain
MKLETALKKARRSSGKTQVEVAAVMGVTGITISNWERGITVPTNGQIMGLVYYYEWVCRSECADLERFIKS